MAESGVHIIWKSEINKDVEYLFWLQKVVLKQFNFFDELVASV